MYLKVFHRQNISEQTLEVFDGSILEQNAPRRRDYVRVQLAGCEPGGSAFKPLNLYVSFDLPPADAEAFRLGAVFQLAPVKP